MSIIIDDNALYDIPGLAKILGITEKTIRKMFVEGRIKGKKLGKKWYTTGATIRAHFEDIPEEIVEEPKVEGKQKKVKEEA